MDIDIDIPDLDLSGVGDALGAGVDFFAGFASGSVGKNKNDNNNGCGCLAASILCVVAVIILFALL